MQYNLNINYGKIAVTGNDSHHVTIINESGENQNLPFNGELDITFIDESDGYFTSFFGSSGYRLNEDNSWTFLTYPLKAFVTENKCYVVLKDFLPVQVVEGNVIHSKCRESNVRSIK